MQAVPSTHAASRKQKMFRDPEHQAQFDASGYLVVDFLADEEVRALRDLFNEIIVRERDQYEFTRRLTYYISIFDKDVAMKRQVDQTITGLFAKRVGEILDDYRVLYCNFMAKAPGAGEIQVHQDNTFVDEDRFTAFNLWTPLEDTTVENGCFHLIPGSHTLLISSRAGSIRNNLTLYNEDIKRYMRAMPLKAGTGILFDHRLFHYSPDNHSETWRPAAQLVLIPNEAQPVLAYYDEQGDPNHLQLYKIDNAYLIDRGLWERPRDLELLMTKQYIPLPPKDELIGLIDAHVQGLS
jgi:ectoine hydroxylase-related dioxygenase (phytanoyl-CoA dioxygenase family)